MENSIKQLELILCIRIQGSLVYVATFGLNSLLGLSIAKAEG